jgi:hypothetical protein
MTVDEKLSVPVSFIDAPHHPHLKTLHHYWQSKCGSRLMPSRADINPADIKSLLPDVIIWSAVDPYIIRLVGDHIVRFVGVNNTGLPATEEMPPDAGRVMKAVLANVVSAKSPRFRIGKAFWKPEKSYRNFESCFLPLSPDDDNVDMILGAIKFD